MDTSPADPYLAKLQLLAQLGSSVALVADAGQLAPQLDAFWLAMSARARARAPWGSVMTLDTFAQAILAGDDFAPLQLTSQGVASHLDTRSTLGGDMIAPTIRSSAAR